jgi:hypothetical protein
MNYVGVDIHKKYSVLCALDESGRKLREGRVEGNASSGFAEFFASLDGPSRAVVEACWNWGLIHDELEELEQVEEVVLAHPYKTRLIADAQIKTDRLDAYALGTLLRGNLVARAHVPGRAKTCYVSDSTGRDCARCCATVFTRCWTDSASWSCRSVATSLAYAAWASCADWNSPNRMRHFCVSN